MLSEVTARIAHPKTHGRAPRASDRAARQPPPPTPGRLVSAFSTSVVEPRLPDLWLSNRLPLASLPSSPLFHTRRGDQPRLHRPRNGCITDEQAPHDRWGPLGP